MDSKDSDYDVRFVFVRPIEEYIQINQPGDVIETAFDKEGRPHEIKGSYIDFAGFDIIKFSKMLSSSNPTTIEWLTSDIVYYGEQNKVFKEFAIKCFNAVSLYHHYKSMCRNNYLKYLKSGDLVTYKKYLYAYRGLVNAKWVVSKKSVPPIIFTECLKGMSKILPKNVFERINKIINLKSEGKEKDMIDNIPELDNYIENFLKDDSEAPKEKSHATLNELRNIILNTKF
jgi:predicted nucleotidyltransferase